LLRIVQLDEKNTRRETRAHTIEDEEPPTKMIKEQIDDYVLISAL
jgi:hypothetical protein